MAANAAGESGVAAVDRALSLLAAFRDGDDALTLAELARRTGLYKSTALRLLASLARLRMAERVPKRAHGVSATSHLSATDAR